MLLRCSPNKPLRSKLKMMHCGDETRSPYIVPSREYNGGRILNAQRINDNGTIFVACNAVVSVITAARRSASLMGGLNFVSCI